MGALHAWDGHHISKQQGLTVKAPEQVQAWISCDAKGTLTVTVRRGQRLDCFPEMTFRVTKPARWRPHSCHSCQRERARGNGSASRGSENPSQPQARPL